jgi:hypothetical protein
MPEPYASAINAGSTLRMIPQSGQRFSEKIVLNQKAGARS